MSTKVYDTNEKTVYLALLRLYNALDVTLEEFERLVKQELETGIARARALELSSVEG